MARTPRSGAPTSKGRPPVVTPEVAKAAAGATARVEADTPRRRTSPAQFAREVRTEARKITWTSWKETWITSVMVLIMVVLSAIFFFIVDFGLRNAVQFLLTLPERFS